VVSGVAFTSGSLAAQDAPYLRKGNIEGNVFLGSSYGLDSWRGSAGGNVAVAVTKNWMPYAEYSYLPGIVRETKTAAGAPDRFSLPAADFHVGVHYRIPFGQKAFVPYLVAGVGMIHWSEATHKVAVINPITNKVDRFDTLTEKSSSDFASNFGGGVRYYVFGESSGFRTELKVYVPTGTYTDPFYKATVGFFYQFK